MIQSLYIKNLAIIDELTIKFSKGLNIITGETGSGKTLIFKAIQLLLGDSFNQNDIRTNSEKIIVEGIFDDFLEIKSIRRIYYLNGKTKSFLNDEPINLKILKNKTAKLIDIYSQHSNQLLLDKNNHIKYLDSFGKYSQNLIELKKIYIEYIENKCLLDKYKKNHKKYLEKEELLDFQFKELELYPISVEYIEDINKKYKFLSNLNIIKENIIKSKNELDNSNNSAVDIVNRVINYMDKIVNHNMKYLEISNRLKNIIIDMQDIDNDLTCSLDEISINKIEYSEIEEILNHIEMLKRKYGGNVESVINFYNELKIKKNNFKNLDDKIKKQELILNKSYLRLIKIINIVSKKRIIASAKLEENVSKNLKILKMDNIIFKIKLFKNNEKIDQNGIDECEFYLSTNKGEKVKPLISIASGGEISRIILAMKMSMKELDLVKTSMFDEIDNGISGSVANCLGTQIELLSKTHQIICITHLSQIASKGLYHMNIEKKQNKDIKCVNVKILSNNERINTIASLISGKNISKASYKHAEFLLNNG